MTEPKSPKTPDPNEFFRRVSKDFHKYQKYIIELLQEDIKSEEFTFRQLSNIYGFDSSFIARHAKIVKVRTPYVDESYSRYEEIYRKLSRRLDKRIGYRSGEKFYSVPSLCEAENIGNHVAVKIVTQLKLDGYIYKSDDGRNYVT